MTVITERMNCFFNLLCCCVGFIIHYFLVFLVEVMAVFPVSYLLVCSFLFSKIDILTGFAVLFIDNVVPVL